MRIGFDVDGVFTDLENYQLKYGKKYFKNVKEEDIHEDEIDIKEIFDCTKAEREKFWIKYIWKYCFMPFEEDMGALVRKLKEEGDDIYIITGRAHTTESGVTGKLFRAMLYHMFKKEDVPYDHIFFCSEKNSDEEKLAICKDNKIDILVDDKKENIDTVKDVSHVICRDRIYNRMYNNPEVVRARNTHDIYNAIERIKNPNYFVELSYDIVNGMSASERIQYYKGLKEYYLNLPFDDKKISETEKNYRMLSKVGVPLYNLFGKPEVFNRELVPNKNGVMYVANHNTYYDFGRMFIETDDFDEVIKHLKNVFGIQELLVGYTSDNLEIDDINNKVLDLVSSKDFKTFKVVTKRSNKSYPINSMEISKVVEKPVAHKSVVHVALSGTVGYEPFFE